MEALQNLDDVFDAFEAEIHKLDAGDFQSVQLQDVRNSAQVIERDREQDGRMCSLGRVEPLLQILGELASTIEESASEKSRRSYLWVNPRSYQSPIYDC